jgi:hypothetical protein
MLATPKMPPRARLGGIFILETFLINRQRIAAFALFIT